MRLYDETCVALCEGQYIDIATAERDDLMSVELYFDMIGRKTAALIAASIEAGALLATDDDAVIARYRAFGWALGLAFQLNDDLLGIWGAEQATGKEPSDIARRKKTLPVIYAFEHAGPEDRERLAALYGNGGPTADDVAEIIAILERTGARDLHPDRGPPPPRRGPRRARRGRRRRSRGARPPRGDHRLGDQRLTRPRRHARARRARGTCA